MFKLGFGLFQFVGAGGDSAFQVVVERSVFYRHGGLVREEGQRSQVFLAEAAFDRANSYANERKQFGHPIGDFQAVQWMLVDSAMELEAAEVLTMHAANLQDQAKNTTKESAMAKLFASESAVRICDRAMQIHGGYGYSRDLPIERYLRDAKLCEIGEGTSQVQRLVIARHVLKEAKPLKLAHRDRPLSNE